MLSGVIMMLLRFNPSANATHVIDGCNQPIDPFDSDRKANGWVSNSNRFGRQARGLSSPLGHSVKVSNVPF